MNRIKLIVEMGVLLASPFVIHHHKVEQPKKPVIIESTKRPSQETAETKRGPDKPTTTVPQSGFVSPQDKGGLSVSKPSESATFNQPTTTSIPSTPVNDNSKTPEIEVIKNITFYGWPDNDPPGGAIAYPIIHNLAGGTGTYADPLTFATKSTFPKGTVLYVPYIQKYVISEDECASCGSSHIDVWLPSNGDFNKEVLACENHWTKSNQEVTLNPPPNLPVSAPLFDIITGRCA